MYRRGLLVDIECVYKTGVVNSCTFQLEKDMNNEELFANVYYIMKDNFLLKKYRLSISDRWSRWHYIA